jgi:hypothetical protein
MDGRAICFLERCSFIEWMSKAIDRLPPWAKFIFWIFTVVASVYLIAREGFWSFLLKLIFSP